MQNSIASQERRGESKTERVGFKVRWCREVIIYFGLVGHTDVGYKCDHSPCRIKLLCSESIIANRNQ